MKCFPVVCVALVLLAVAGCKPKAKDIPPLQRKEAASLASEGQFAVVMKDHARAEPLFEKAAKLCPDNGEFWLSLGMTRRRLGNTAGARAAYNEAVSAYHDAYALDHTQVDALLQELYTLCLLGKVDEARSAFAKAQKGDPENPRFRAFAENKHIDRLLQDAGFKELAL